MEAARYFTRKPREFHAHRDSSIYNFSIGDKLKMNVCITAEIKFIG
jgi:hypothetical protein